MKQSKILVYLSLLSFIVAIGMFAYLVNASKALSYLSDNPKACINCHVMFTQYQTWQHSSHQGVATCVECHLPTDGFFAKYLAKAKDGFNHSVAFTMGSYQQSIAISQDGANRVQANCISCHSNLAATLVDNAQNYHNFKNPTEYNDRWCWDCHKEVPHGRVRSLSATPNAIGIREWHQK
ncbi:cytochrome c nitrite reductase small subunit [Helicobacter monodelphidis]|uniref:cytochrome c nitrite reductase small subunit n=1 Tax=Helicobacter sp. 15-1451 TaxID=2004995 RepID=UPI000DCBACE8|nr:cytochrome c nitrite reductase small subunit [Helicobacter sp. 15-1451]RAX57668.1 cytochrome c nitrite reductase small subunit [Helicobacter sp. 15-1451]